MLQEQESVAAQAVEALHKATEENAAAQAVAKEAQERSRSEQESLHKQKVSLQRNQEVRSF